MPGNLQAARHRLVRGGVHDELRYQGEIEQRQRGSTVRKQPAGGIKIHLDGPQGTPLHVVAHAAVARLADGQIRVVIRQQPFRFIPRGADKAEADFSHRHFSNHPVQKGSGRKRIVDQRQVLRGTVRHLSGKRLKGFYLPHQEVRLALKLFPFGREPQGAAVANKQRVAQPILKKINQIAKRRAVLLQRHRGFTEAPILGHGGKCLELCKRVNQSRHATLPLFFRGIFPHYAFFIIAPGFLN